MIEEMGRTSGFEDWTWTRYEHKPSLLEAMEECEGQGKRYRLDFEVLTRRDWQPAWRERGIWPIRWKSFDFVSVDIPMRVWGLTVERKSS